MESRVRTTGDRVARGASRGLRVACALCVVALTAGAQAQTAPRFRLLERGDHNDPRYDEIGHQWLGGAARGALAHEVWEYGLWSAVPAAALLAAAFGWSWLLKRRVTQQTRELAAELAERKRAEVEGQAHIRHLECMEQVNRAIQQAGDPNQMLWDVVRTTFSIFECDRAWLVYPCDPDAPTFRVVVEVTRPEYLGGRVLDHDLPMGADQGAHMRDELDAPGPRCRTAGTASPVARENAEQFGVQAQMSMALRPRVGKPWVFGLHQCSYARAWTAEEQRLLQEIGRRLTDGLSTALSLRDLRKSEATYRAVVENIPDVIFTAATDGTLTYVSPAVESLLGLTAEELTGRRLDDFLEPGDCSAYERAWHTACTGVAAVEEHRLRRKDGRTCWVRTALQPIVEDGVGTRVQGIITDITEHKQFEQSIRQRLEALTDPELRDADVRIDELLDISAVQTLMENFHAITGLASAVLDLNENVLVAAGWQDACTRFHRVHPETCARCRASDAYIKTHLPDHGYVAYPCENGLWDMAIPIRIRGRHIATFFFGQVLLQDTPVDEEFFRQQARQFGFDETEYLAAIHKVPVLSQATVQAVMRYYEQLANLLTAMGLKNLAQARSIAERKRIAEALQDSERKLHSILEGSPTPAFVIDQDHRVIHWNKALEQLTGLRREDVHGTPQHWRAFYTEERPCMADLLVEGRAAEFAAWYGARCTESDLVPGAFEVTDHFPHVGAHGAWLRLTAAAIRDSAGRMVGALETLEDVTAKHQAENALRESEERYRTLFDGVPVGLFRTTPTGQVLDANAALMELLGYPDRETLLAAEARTFWIEPEARTQWGVLMERDGVARGVEVKLRRSDGSAVDVRINSQVVRDAQGHILHYRGSVEDVTAQKRVQGEKDALEAQLRQALKMEAVGQLAGGVAHDFNNILTAIFGNVEMALGELSAFLPPNSRSLEGLRQIEQSAERAAALTRQLLAFSRRQITQPEIVNLNTTIANLQKMLRRLITENIALEVIPEPELQLVQADPCQLEQVLINLAVNARDAMPDGGRLTIETANFVLDDDYVAQHAEARPGPHVVLAVSDTGCGMDAATLERIFEPFFTTKPVGEGTGIGLSTVYGIVKQSGGHIMVYSEPGRGSTFRIYLPVCTASAAETYQAERAGDPPTGTETILICEDDAAVLELAALMLSSAGYQVLSASGAAQAEELLRAAPESIQLLITDVIMPDTNGKALSAALTAIRPDLRTLYVSGYTANVIAHHGVLEAGVNFLEKPFSRDKLLRRVRAVLDPRPTARVDDRGGTRIDAGRLSSD